MLDPAYDVALYVHASWCKACKGFKRTWDELAETLAHVPTLRLAELSMDNNEHELVQVQVV